MCKRKALSYRHVPSEDIPRLPDDLTEIDDRDLMMLMREHLAWVEYSGYRLARGEIEERELDMHISQRLAFILVSQWGGSSDRVAIVKAEGEGDREVKAMRDKHIKAMAYRKIIQNLYEAADRRVNLISRELTRRTSMEPMQRRAHKFGGA